MSKRVKTYMQIGMIACLVILADQATKLLIRNNLRLRETWMPIEWLEPYARFIHWKNTGVAFGLFQGSGWILTAIGLVVILLIVFFYKAVITGPTFWRVALGLQLGGAIGNLLDRVNPQVGYVVDFIWIGNFPVFNLADVAIVIGAFVMLIGIWKLEEADKKKAEMATLAPDTAGTAETALESNGASAAMPAVTTENAAVKLPELPAFDPLAGH